MQVQLYRQLLDATGVGIEVAVRLGMGGYDRELGNSVFFDRGQHATSICGAIGAAVVRRLVDAAILPDLLARETATFNFQDLRVQVGRPAREKRQQTKGPIKR